MGDGGGAQVEVEVEVLRGGVSSERYEGGKTVFDDDENDIPREFVVGRWREESE